MCISHSFHFFFCYFHYHRLLQLPRIRCQHLFQPHQSSVQSRPLAWSFSVPSSYRNILQNLLCQSLHDMFSTWVSQLRLYSSALLVMENICYSDCIVLFLRQSSLLQHLTCLRKFILEA